MDSEIAKLITSLGNWTNWTIVPVIALLAGAIGGLAKRLTAPPEDKTPIYSYLVVGGIASIAVLFVLTPADGVKLIAQSLAAGYAGKAILEALQEKVKTALAKKDAEEAKEKGKQAVDTGMEAVKAAQHLVQMHKDMGKAFSADVIDNLPVPLPSNVKSFVTLSPETTEQDLIRMAARLNSLKESF
jgi:hypothetical protein